MVTNYETKLLQKTGLFFIYTKCFFLYRMPHLPNVFFIIEMSVVFELICYSFQMFSLREQRVVICTCLKNSTM